MCIMQSEVMRFGRQNSEDEDEEEMYVRGESELTATKYQLPRKTTSESAQLPSRPTKKVSTFCQCHVNFMSLFLILDFSRDFSCILLVVSIA